MAFHFIEFAPSAFTSMTPGSLYSASGSTAFKLTSDKLGLHSWSTHPHEQFPQEFVVELGYRCEVAHLILQSDTDKELRDVKIYMGD